VCSFVGVCRVFTNIAPAGFGLGALNDADDDDLDVYETSSNIRNRTAYDIADREEDDKIAISSKSERGKRAQGSNIVGNSQSRTRQFTSSLMF
jgi:hypothetical protein